MIDQGQALGWLILLFFSVTIVQFFAGRLYQKNKDRDESPKPELTEEELTQFDELPSGVAVTLAWTEGANQKAVRDDMPVLGRALDRMINVNFSEKDN